MAIKRLSKDKLEHVENQRLKWLEWQNKLRLEPMHSDKWFAILRERNACYDILISTTGLTRSRIDNLIYGQVTAETFWLADGTIRKDHPHE